MTKRCPKCSETKPVTAFYKRADGRCQSYCMKCGAEASNEHRRRRVRSRTPHERAQWNLKRRLSTYRLTERDLLALLEAQDGRCACGDELDITTLCIDHDHDCCPHDGSCGRCVRGVLCIHCNTALGHLKDDPNRAMALATYLLRFEDVLQLSLEKGVPLCLSQ